MAEQAPNAEQIVNDLTQPGKEAELEQALNDEFNGKTADQKPAAGDQTPENKANEPGKENQEPSKPGDQQPVDDKGNQNRFADILKDRNESRKAAADKAMEAQAKDQRIAELEAENAKLKNPTAKGAGEQPAAEDLDLSDPAKAADYIQKQIADGIAKALGEKDQKANTEKSDAAEVDALIADPEVLKRNPEIANDKAKITEVMAKHPTLSAFAAYLLLEGLKAHDSFGDETAGSNASKTSTGKRPKSTLSRDKKPEDMTTEEMEAHLRNEQASGNLSL